jgi:hypothetical protein
MIKKKRKCVRKKKQLIGTADLICRVNAHLVVSGTTAEGSYVILEIVILFDCRL